MNSSLYKYLCSNITELNKLLTSKAKTRQNRKIKNMKLASLLPRTMRKTNFYLQIDGIQIKLLSIFLERVQAPKLNNFFFLLRTSTITDTWKMGETAVSVCEHLLEAVQVCGFPQIPLHLACPSLNGHVKHLLIKLYHKPAQNTRINLACKTESNFHPL